MESTITIKIQLVAENGKDQFECQIQDLLFLKAADNYIEIHHKKGISVKKTMLRNTLQRMEEQIKEQAINTKIIRCHRSYLIHLDQVKSISGNAQGYKLHLNEKKETIPVSRSKSKTIYQQAKLKIMKRNISLLIIIFLSVATIAISQITIAGTISTKNTTTENNKLSYANIGILNTSIGTVSDENGDFTLYLKEAPQPTDTLRISLIGYKTQSFGLSEITAPMNIQLEKEIFDLTEVIVRPKFSNTKITGRQKTNGSMKVNFSISKKPRQNLGAEIGKKFKIKRKKTSQVESLRFFIRSNDFEEVKFRVLFYNIKRGKPGRYLTDQDIIVTVKNKQTGWIEVDLSEYDIITKKNFIATLQWIDASEEGRSLAMPIKLPVFGSHHFYKFGSQAKWKHFRNMSTSMNVTLAY